MRKTVKSLESVIEQLQAEKQVLVDQYQSLMAKWHKCISEDTIRDDIHARGLFLASDMNARQMVEMLIDGYVKHQELDELKNQVKDLQFQLDNAYKSLESQTRETTNPETGMPEYSWHPDMPLKNQELLESLGFKPGPLAEGLRGRDLLESRGQLNFWFEASFYYKPGTHEPKPECQQALKNIVIRANNRGLQAWFENWGVAIRVK